MTSFPPHTSHKLQPLDVGVYGPFKTYCSVAFNDWLTSNPGKTITIKQIAQLTKIAFQAAFTQKNITKSFETPGLWPVNRLAFKDEEFAASFVNQSNNETVEDRSTHTDTTSTSASTFQEPGTPPKISIISTANQGKSIPL